jgi:hypothetical protein
MKREKGLAREKRRSSPAPQPASDTEEILMPGKEELARTIHE